MPTIKILQDVSLFNSITAASAFQADTGTFLTSVAVGTNSPDPTKALHVSGDVLITGTISAVGESYFVNSTFTTTSALSVSNNGTGPALVAVQTGEQPIAAFYDDANIALYIDGTTAAPGFVGVKTSTPNVELTVVGSISATGAIYGPNVINKSVQLFGDAINTDLEIPHTFGHSDLIVTVLDDATKEVVYPSVTYTDNTKITVSFADVPGLSAYKAIIIG